MAGRRSGRVTSRKVAQRPAPEGPRGLLHPRVEVAPQPADGPHHHGVVEEHVREQDRPDAVLQAELRGARPEHRRQQRVHRAAWSEEAQERRRDHDRRQHERDRDRGPQQPRPAEAVAGQHVRARHPDHQRQHRRDDRLPHREPEDAPQARVGGDALERRQVEGAVRDEPRGDDRRHGVGEEQQHEAERHRGQRPPAGSTPRRRRHRQRSTVSVHASIQASRFSPISAGSIVIGASGSTACCTNTSGRVASRFTG